MLVEIIIGSVRQSFQILSATGVLQNEFVLHKIQNGSVILDSIVRVCRALNNVIEGVIPFVQLALIIVAMIAFQLEGSI